jgi:hypothetical protein
MTSQVRRPPNRRNTPLAAVSVPPSAPGVDKASEGDIVSPLTSEQLQPPEAAAEITVRSGPVLGPASRTKLAILSDIPGPVNDIYMSSIYQILLDSIESWASISDRAMVGGRTPDSVPKNGYGAS